MELKRVVCPIDFSHAGPHGIPASVALARRFEAELVLMHVIDFPSPQVETVVPAAQIKAYLEARTAEAEHHLDELLAEHHVEGLTVRYEIVRGVPHERIVSFAEADDVLVIPARDLSHLDRVFLGSTAKKVVRLANCPVLTIPPQRREIAFAPTKIVFATDFSDYADAALSPALSVADRFDADLIMVHVVTVHEADPANPDWTFPEIPAEFVDEVERAATKELDSRSEHAQEHKIAVETRMRRGFDPAAEIISLVEEEDADLVVMATHGHTGLIHALLGSTAEKVIRDCPVPVLTVRQPED